MAVVSEVFPDTAFALKLVPCSRNNIANLALSIRAACMRGVTPSTPLDSTSASQSSRLLMREIFLDLREATLSELPFFISGGRWLAVESENEAWRQEALRRPWQAAT